MPSGEAECGRGEGIPRGKHVCTFIDHEHDQRPHGCHLLGIQIDAKLVTVRLG